MTHDQLTGRYAQLRSELADAYADPEWSASRTGRIDRIADELALTEMALATGRYQHFAEPTGDQAALSFRPI